MRYMIKDNKQCFDCKNRSTDSTIFILFTIAMQIKFILIKFDYSHSLIQLF